MYKTLEFVKKGSNGFTNLEIGLCLNGNSFETERYLEQQILAIDKEIQKMNDDTLNTIGLFKQTDMLPLLTPSSELDKVEGRLNRKIDDVRNEVNERLDKDMPIVEHVHEKLTQAELEQTVKDDEAE